jgi:hypothetical protein
MTVPKRYVAKSLAEAQRIQDNLKKEKIVDKVDGKIKK